MKQTYHLVEFEDQKFRLKFQWTTQLAAINCRPWLFQNPLVCLKLFYCERQTEPAVVSILNALVFDVSRIEAAYLYKLMQGWYLLTMNLKELISIVLFSREIVETLFRRYGALHCETFCKRIYAWIPAASEKMSIWRKGRDQFNGEWNESFMFCPTGRFYVKYKDCGPFPCRSTVFSKTSSSTRRDSFIIRNALNVFGTSQTVYN